MKRSARNWLIASIMRTAVASSGLRSSSIMRNSSRAAAPASRRWRRWRCARWSARLAKPPRLGPARRSRHRTAPCAEATVVHRGRQVASSSSVPPSSDVASPMRRNGDVDALAGVRAGRQVGGDNHRRDVAVSQRGAARVDAEAIDHRLYRLLGEGNIAQRVAGALQADDQTVADELVVALSAQRRNILDAHRGATRKSCMTASPATARSRARIIPRSPARFRPAGRGPRRATPLSALRSMMTSPMAPSCNGGADRLDGKPPST